MLIESKQNKKLADLLQTYVFTPLGMNKSFKRYDVDVGDRAAGIDMIHRYLGDDNAAAIIVSADRWDWSHFHTRMSITPFYQSAFYGSASTLTNASDLMKFVNSVKQPDALAWHKAGKAAGQYGRGMEVLSNGWQHTGHGGALAGETNGMLFAGFAPAGLPQQLTDWGASSFT